MSNFSTKGVQVVEGGSVGKYLSYGVQEAMITGFEVKTASTGKQQVMLLLEGPKVTTTGFEPDPTSKFGGKVGKVQFTIYFAPGDKEEGEFIQKVALIAKKLGVSEKIDTIEASGLQEYLNKITPILRGKMLWWAITAEEYQKKDSDRVGYTLGLRRYGFVASKEEMEVNPNHIKPFDKGNKYDYKALSSPSKDPDVDPITEAFGETGNLTLEEMPWD